MKEEERGRKKREKEGSYLSQLVLTRFLVGSYQMEHFNFGRVAKGWLLPLETFQWSTLGPVGQNLVNSAKFEVKARAQSDPAGQDGPEEDLGALSSSSPRWPRTRSPGS